MIQVRDTKLYPLIPNHSGRHRFGGPPCHQGTSPHGTTIPVHLLLLLDLTDSAAPFRSETITKLPLYYPLKYGCGGPSMQYEILSDYEINILFMSDETPDDPDETYVKVDALPELRYSLGTPTDRDSLDWFVTTIGGSADEVPAETCRNASCPDYKADATFDLIARIPPKPIDGHEGVWWEFEGAFMKFFFIMCRSCKTIIGSNYCT